MQLGFMGDTVKGNKVRGEGTEGIQVLQAAGGDMSQLLMGQAPR